eukprot:m.143373 g.143373  ORF g.143373 m.143373 type:complete len:328 (-) comp14091_c1_seq1:223-1206(-)
MPRLTKDMLVAAGQKSIRKHRDDTIDKYLARLTHINLARRKLDTLDHINLCHRLMVAYLYENRILRISNIGACTRMTHLYLQDNKIERIESLGRLKHLSVLSLSKNKITVVEGLHTLRNLKELIIDSQALPPGEQLVFDPRTLDALTPSLTRLDVSGNNLHSVWDIFALQRLETLLITNNTLTDLGGVMELLKSLPFLSTLSVKGNPFCLMSKFKEELVVSSRSLQILDGQDITPTYREFLSNWKTVLDSRREAAFISRKATPPDPYARPALKRVGVTLSPKFPSRLRATNTFFLPPMTGGPPPSVSGARSATLAGRTDHAPTGNTT